MSYLDIARNITPEYERNERNEKSLTIRVIPPSIDAPTSVGVETVRDESPGDPRQLTAAEMASAGLNARLIWMHVACYQQSVEASEPPATWDGELPLGCCYRHLCEVLGPCPHAVARCKGEGS